MFTDVHLRELEPAAWREDMVGKGSYGVVYRATWRGQQVAVKELKVPDEPEDTVRGDTASLEAFCHVRAIDIKAEEGYIRCGTCAGRAR